MSIDVEGAQDRLSTRPDPVPERAGRLGPIGQARRTWRQLTSMRTALLLLVLLALGAVPGSLLPQRANSPSRVAKYFADHPTLAHLFDRLGLFDTFHAPWFAAIYALLFVSLAGCVLPRMKMHVQTLLGRPPAAPARLGRMPESATWETALPSDQALAHARDLLRRKRFRTNLEGSAVAAEKGYLRETGNLLFHGALLALLVGVGIGSLFGYQGQVLLTQGRSLVNAASDYDAYKPGALTGPNDLSPFSVKLNEFTASYEPDGAPKTFDAFVTATSAAGVAKDVDLRVNHPITYGSAKVYLIGHGYALHVTVRNAAGSPVFDDVVPCIPQDLRNYLSSCVVKVPNTGARQPASYTDPKTGKTYSTNADGTPYSRPLVLSALINFAPTGAFDEALGLTSLYPAPKLPRAVIGVFTGDYGVNTPQSVYDLNTRNLTPVAIPAADAVVTPGVTGAIPLTQGFTLTVGEVSQYATLQVKDDPGKLLTLVSAALVVVGLIASLRVRRRRVWLRATPREGGRTLIEVGGLARSDSDDFRREFRGLVGRLARTVPPATQPYDAPADRGPADPAPRTEDPDARQ